MSKKESISIGALVETLRDMNPTIRTAILRDAGIELKDSDEISDEEKAKIFISCLLDSYDQELLEIKEEFGAPNVKGLFYSEHRGTWVLQFKNGIEDSEFDTKAHMIEFIKTESQEE
jgi:hypothetical protein